MNRIYQNIIRNILLCIIFTIPFKDFGEVINNNCNSIPHSDCITNRIPMDPLCLSDSSSILYIEKVLNSHNNNDPNIDVESIIDLYGVGIKNDIRIIISENTSYIQVYNYDNKVYNFDDYENVDYGIFLQVKLDSTTTKSLNNLVKETFQNNMSALIDSLPSIDREKISRVSHTNLASIEVKDRNRLIKESYNINYLYETYMDNHGIDPFKHGFYNLHNLISDIFSKICFEILCYTDINGRSIKYEQLKNRFFQIQDVDIFFCERNPAIGKLRSEQRKIIFRRKMFNIDNKKSLPKNYNNEMITITIDK